MTRKLYPSLPLACIAAAVIAGSLGGCAVVAVGAAAGGAAYMMNDRRSSGAQIDDETIEMRANSRLKEDFGERAHINVASYNRQVLLTGEVPTEAAKQQAEQIVSRVDSVRGVVNELAVAPPTSLSQRSTDVLVTGKVRASFVDAADLQAQSFRVVTERGTVYLMGRVTAREAERATNIARQVPGVQRVVRIFEVMTPEEMRQAGIPAPSEFSAQPATRPASAPVAPAATAAEAAPAMPAPGSGGAVATPVR